VQQVIIFTAVAIILQRRRFSDSIHPLLYLNQTLRRRVARE
jgi:hypothetical protein